MSKRRGERSKKRETKRKTKQKNRTNRVVEFGFIAEFDFDLANFNQGFAPLRLPWNSILRMNSQPSFSIWTCFCLETPYSRNICDQQYDCLPGSFSSSFWRKTTWLHANYVDSWLISQLRALESLAQVCDLQLVFALHVLVNFVFQDAEDNSLDSYRPVCVLFLGSVIPFLSRLVLSCLFLCLFFLFLFCFPRSCVLSFARWL